jgi:hypothetical protein
MRIHDFKNIPDSIATDESHVGTVLAGRVSVFHNDRIAFLILHTIALCTVPDDSDFSSLLQHGCQFL